MTHLVSDQEGALGEALPTLQALLGLLPIVKLLRDPQVRALALSPAACPAQAGAFLLAAPWPGFGALPCAGSLWLFLPARFPCHGAAANSLFHEVLLRGFVLPALHAQLLVCSSHKFVT